MIKINKLLAINLMLFQSFSTCWATLNKEEDARSSATRQQTIGPDFFEMLPNELMATFTTKLGTLEAFRLSSTSQDMALRIKPYIVTIDLERKTPKAHLGNVPEAVISCVNLTSLDLSNFGLTSLSSEVRALSKLKILNLSNNTGLFKKSIEAVIFLTKLEELDIENCGVTILPSTLKELHVLKKLNISRNAFYPEFVSSNGAVILPLKVRPEEQMNPDSYAVAPAVLQFLTNLESLSMAGCHLKKFDDWFGKLINLHFLDLSFNIFEVMPSPALFKSLTNLENLVLRKSNIPQDLLTDFALLTWLRALDITENGLETEDFSMFSSTVKIITNTKDDKPRISDIFLNKPKIQVAQEKTSAAVNIDNWYNRYIWHKGSSDENENFVSRSPSPSRSSSPSPSNSLEVSANIFGKKELGVEQEAEDTEQTRYTRHEWLSRRVGASKQYGSEAISNNGSSSIQPTSPLMPKSRSISPESSLSPKRSFSPASIGSYSPYTSEDEKSNVYDFIEDYDSDLSEDEVGN